jgi:hypothetical protein
MSSLTSRLFLALLYATPFVNAVLSQGCTHPDKSPIDWRPKANDSRIFQVASDPTAQREIRVRIPANYNESNVMLPLILAYHDKEMSTGEMEFQTRLSDPRINDNFIVVYPTAKNVCSSFKYKRAELLCTNENCEIGYMAIRHVSPSVAEK